ncbi:hypothetical protein [Streptomyces sp. NPDC049555]|uniref:hypothetical protein n=1 Tax=Streptomyces sp. NPDC049555 TaxID=3154930 RepID=UPI00342ACFAE
MKRAAAVAVGAIALFGAAQGAAQAAPAAAGGTVPSCVVLDAPYSMFGGMQKATVTNNCGQTVSVKLVYPNGPGSTCHTVEPQKSVVEEYWSLGFGWGPKSLVAC